MNRRQFIATSLAATAGMVAKFSQASQGTQKITSNMKVSLYSITFLGIWYRGEALTLEQMIERAKKYGYEGLEIDGKRPHGNPLDWPARRCKELKTISQGEGVPIHGVAANNDFSSPIPEYRECQVAYVKELIRMTSDLGARTLRMFLAWGGVTKHPQIAQYTIARNIWKQTHEEFSEEEIWAWCREAMVECARYSGQRKPSAIYKCCPILGVNMKGTKTAKSKARHSIDLSFGRCMRLDIPAISVMSYAIRYPL